MYKTLLDISNLCSGVLPRVPARLEVQEMKPPWRPFAAHLILCNNSVGDKPFVFYEFIFPLKVIMVEPENAHFLCNLATNMS